MLKNDEKRMIIRNCQEQLDQLVDPVEKEFMKGFISGIWCCIDD